MKTLHFILDTVKNTLKFRINSKQYKTCLDYFKCKDSLWLPSGRVFAQGNGWYECHLNEDQFETFVAADRFKQALLVALYRGAEILASKAACIKRELEIRALQIAGPARRVLKTIYQKTFGHHGTWTTKSRIKSAADNRDAEVLKDCLKYQPV
jgi:hypothetical protein